MESPVLCICAVSMGHAHMDIHWVCEKGLWI